MGELAPGFRFYPTEEELVSFYLHNMLESNHKKPHIGRVIPLLDIYQLDPWQLPKHSGELCHGDTEQWFFFMPRQEREVRGGRPSRTTGSGYWKATGSPSYVFSSESKVIGVKKNMVFYKGKAPTGTKTKWKMNEYRAIKEDSCTSIPRLRHEVSLCRVYVVSGSSRAFDRRPIHVADDQTFPPTGSVKMNEADDDRVKTGAGLLQTSCSSGSSFSEGNCINTDKMMLNSCLEILMEWDDVN